MFKKMKINEDEATSLNYGIPIVLTLFFFIFNGVIYSVYFAESIVEIIKMYLFVAFLILLIDFIRAKLKKGAKIIIQVNAYKNILLTMILVLMFFGVNFISAKTIFETKVFCDYKYGTSLKEYTIPPNFFKFYELTEEERQTYFHGDYLLHIQVGKSIFGYKILTKRSFEKVKKIY